MNNSRALPSVPAGEMERFVVDQIKRIGRDPLVIEEKLAQARSQAEDEIERLKAERGRLRGRLRDDHAEVGRSGHVTQAGLT